MPPLIALGRPPALPAKAMPVKAVLQAKAKAVLQAKAKAHAWRDSAKREPQSDGEGEANKSRNPQKKRRRGEEAPLDYKGMTWCVYLWGQKSKIIIDALVLGESLKESGTRARMVACVDASTLELPMSVHLERFWEVMVVKHLEIPQRLVEAGMDRLKGVYSKLQVWKFFDDDPHWKAKRVCMVDVDMMFRSHPDAMWSFPVPSSVMRGNTDSPAYAPRPQATYYFRGDSSRYEQGKEKMAGGINGGLVYFEPDAREFERMFKHLCSGKWQAVTEMAEQEFLSHWFSGRWHALPPEFNFQLHHVFLSSQWWPPKGQERPSKYYQMLNNPGIIKNWHYSGEREPVDLLLHELEPGDSDEVIDLKVARLAKEGMDKEWRRMHDDIKGNKEHLKLILSVHEQATHEWLQGWKVTWKTIFTGALSEISQHAFAFSQPNKIICNACGHAWGNRTEFGDQARDHVLVNCPEALKDIEISVTKCPNLMLLPFAPVGKNVEGHLDYLGKVIQKWRLYGWSNWQNEEVQQAFEMRCDDAVKPDIPMYSTAHGLLMAPPEPSQEDVEDEADPVKAKRKFLRRMQTRWLLCARIWQRNLITRSRRTSRC